MALTVYPYRRPKRRERNLFGFQAVAQVPYDYMVVSNLQRNAYTRERLDWLEKNCGDDAWMGSHVILFAYWEHAVQYVLTWDA